MQPQSPILRVLSERGFIRQCTDLAALDAACASGEPLRPYIGFDLTAPSLHVGSLIQIMALKWFLIHDQRPQVLFGSATTRIGDPTGKNAMRPQLDDMDIETNRVGILAVFDRILGHIQTLDNGTWFDGLKFMNVLREFGPHFTVNRMLTLDSVKSRLDRKEPMTFLEFNYSIMQAMDFLYIFQSSGCRLQVGGSDQWGNIVSGVDLVRRKTGAEVFGLTTPLMTNTAGEKMGKTAGGAIWLDPRMTSPFDFWQFWRNVEDEKVEEFLKLFTMLDFEQIDLILSKGINFAKIALADRVTAFVHGADAVREIAVGLRENSGAGLQTFEFTPVQLFTGRDCLTIADIMVEIGMVKSKGEADRLAANGGVTINGEKRLDVRQHLTPDDLGPDDRSLVLGQGKKKRVSIRLSDAV